MIEHLLWCVKRFKQEQEQHSEQVRDKRSSEKIVENALFCLKQSQSAKDLQLKTSHIQC